MIPNKLRFHMTRNIIALSENERIKNQSTTVCQSMPIYLDNIFENDDFIVCIKLEESVSKLNYKEI